MEKLNIFQKLQKARVDVQNMNLKKSGENKFAGYKYYELADFLPAINIVMDEVGLCPIITFENDYAIMRLYDCDNADSFIEFKSPLIMIEQKGSNAIQALGSVETYSRRYLYMTALEIVENDYSEAMTKSEDKITEGTLGQIKLLVKEYAELLDGRTEDDVMEVLKAKFKFERLEAITNLNGQTVINILASWIAKTKKSKEETA